MNNENNSLIPEPIKEINPEVLIEEVDDKHTIFLDEVPSDVAYRMVTKSLEEGEILSKEEVMARIEEPIRMSYNEFYKKLLAMTKEQEKKNDNFYHIEKPMFYERPIFFGENQEDSLGAKDFTETTEAHAHRPSLWHVNPNNPDEEIQECLDCGAIIDRRSKHTHQYIGTRSTNEELLKMLNNDDTSVKIEENTHNYRDTIEPEEPRFKL